MAFASLVSANPKTRTPPCVPAHRAGDLLLEEGLGGAALREERTVRPEDDDAEGVRGLRRARELPPERGLEGEGPEPPSEVRDSVRVRMGRELLERRLDLLRFPGLQEMAERREL